MSFYRSKSSTGEPVWFLVERDGGESTPYQRGTREAALDDFTAWLRGAARAGEGFTPYDRTRRLAATGPDWVIQPDDHTDPLLIGDAALRSVLSPGEYRLIVHGPIATALLES